MSVWKEPVIKQCIVYYFGNTKYRSNVHKTCPLVLVITIVFGFGFHVKDLLSGI